MPAPARVAAPAPAPTRPIALHHRIARWLAGPRVALLVVACTLAVYLRTLAPTVTTEDSGELVTAAARWGVAHPPGYPLYCLILQPFVRSPFWSPAFGGNLASALFGALAAGGVTLVTLRLGARARFAAAAGLLWAFARDVWAQSVIAEVYTLNALLLVGILLLVLRFSEEKRVRDLQLAAALFGLALANHYPLTLLAFPAIAVFVARVKGVPWSPRRLLSVAGLSVAGLSVYAYLPLAAGGQPPLNWGDPSTWERFLAHVSRSAYRAQEVGHLSRLQEKASFVALFFELVAAQWTAPVLVLLLAAGFWRLRERPAQRDLLFGTTLLTGLCLTLILNYPHDHENIQRMDEVYLPVYVALAPVLGLGLAQAAAEIERRAPSFARAANIVLPALFLVPLALHFRHDDLSNDRLAYDHNTFALESLPPDSVYYTSGDYSSFPTLYLQAVEGRRPDVILANVTGELSPAARRYLAEIDPSIDPNDKGAAQLAFLERGTRPLLVASKSDLRVAAPVEPWGLVYLVRGGAAGAGTAAGGAAAGSRAEPATGSRAPDLLAAKIALPDVLSGADGLLRTLLSDHHLMRGEALFARGDRDGAIEAFGLATRAQPDSKESVNNVASTAAERGFPAEAERWFRKAAALSPTYITPRRNLARLLDGAGRRDEAIEAYRDLLRLTPDDEPAKARLTQLERGQSTPPANRPAPPTLDELLAAIREDPTKPALHNNQGNGNAEQSDAPRARAAYERAIELDPGYLLAHKNLGVLHRDLLKDPTTAARHFEKYRTLGGK